MAANIAEVIPLPASPTLDIPYSLRKLADSLEAESAAYGEGFVMRVTVVVRVSNDEPIIYGYGDNPPTQAFMDLHAGASQLLMMKSPKRC